MDMDMKDLLEEIARVVTEAPQADAPADYLHQRGLICADALRSVADGAHPAEALETMEERLEDAARPATSAPLMVWTPVGVS